MAAITAEFGGLKVSLIYDFHYSGLLLIAVDLEAAAAVYTSLDFLCYLAFFWLVLHVMMAFGAADEQHFISVY